MKLSESEKIDIVLALDRWRSYNSFIENKPVQIRDICDQDVTPFLKEHADQLGIVVDGGKIWFTSYEKFNW